MIDNIKSFNFNEIGIMCRAILVSLCVIVFYVMPANALPYVSPFDLKGKTIILPPYQNGNDYFPFVYQKECFYTGKTQKKMKANEKFLGVPIKILDVQVVNKGSSSEKFCLLFSNENGEFSLVIPLSVSSITKEMDVFHKLFFQGYLNTYHTPYLYDFRKIGFFCYDYPKIKRMEDNCTNKRVVTEKKCFTQSETFVRFVFMGNNQDVVKSDFLYAEFDDGIKSEKFAIAPCGEHGDFVDNIKVWTIEELEELFK